MMIQDFLLAGFRVPALRSLSKISLLNQTINYVE